jgi:hypothetical protein
MDTDCRRCDWECFRDPSELFGPFLEGRKNPIRLLKQLRKDKIFFQYWKSDFRYYKACDFFNGRRPPQLNKMEKFAPPESDRRARPEILSPGRQTQEGVSYT